MRKNSPMNRTCDRAAVAAARGPLPALTAPRRPVRRGHTGALRAAALVALAATLPLAAHGERADRDKEANVTADHSTLDDLHQVQVLTGHVVLIKGTMRLGGERMEHRQDEQGYQFYVVTAAPGELATFHERRDPVREGVESTLDGFAERIDYDDRTDKVILTGRAVVKRFENGEQRDELSGARIVYDARKSNYDVDGRNPDGTGSRVHMIIAPRAGAAPATAPTPATPGHTVPAGRDSQTVPPPGTGPAPASPANPPASTNPPPAPLSGGADAKLPASGAAAGKSVLAPIPPPQPADLRSERTAPGGDN